MSHFVLDAVTRRAIFIQRFADGESQGILDILADVKNKVVARMSREGNIVNSQRLSLMLADVQTVLDRGFTDVSDDLFSRLIDFGEDEALFNQTMFADATTTIPSPLNSQQVQVAIFRTTLEVPVGASDISIKEAAEQFSRKKSVEIMQVIKDGFGSDQTVSQMTKSISDLMDNRQRQQARTLVRTSVNATSNKVRAAFYANNQGILEGYEWVSTLDARTSFICAGRDGIVYKIGKGPLPPAHWGCRSTTVPKIREDLVLDKSAGTRPQVGAEGPGTISAKVTYDSWLRRQPANFQDEVLGPSRAGLFRRGNLDVRDFRDETGRTYSLDRLKSLQPMAFQKANIEI